MRLKRAEANKWEKKKTGALITGEIDLDSETNGPSIEAHLYNRGLESEYRARLWFLPAETSRLTGSIRKKFLAPYKS